jgi:hypothetical protein
MIHILFAGGPDQGTGLAAFANSHDGFLQRCHAPLRRFFAALSQTG